MNELHLFAGAGGGILAGQLLGNRCVCAVEWEPYAQAVLVARQNDGTFPPFPIWSDVQTFDGTPWRGTVDVVAGGFPCQDISVAGGGQEPVAKAVSLTTGIGLQWIGDPLPAGTALYTRALPAQPDQDVNAGLVESFSKLYKKYINLLEAGRDRILDLGGTCDPVDTMEMSDPGLRDARTALANAKAAPVQDKHLNNLRNAVNILQSCLNGTTSPHLAQASVNALNAYIDAAAPKQEQKGGEA